MITRSTTLWPVSGSPVTTPIYVYALGLSKVASAGVVEAGELLTYTITVTNLHPLADMTSVQLSDAIPVGTTFVTATLPHTFDGTTVTWTNNGAVAHNVTGGDFASSNLNPTQQFARTFLDQDVDIVHPVAGATGNGTIKAMFLNVGALKRPMSRRSPVRS